MARLDKGAAQLLAVVLGLVALIGFGQGLAQALKAPRPEQVAAGVDPSRDPVPNAAALSGSPAMDEARVRQIAREEATAALGVTRKKPAAVPKVQDDSADDDAPAHAAAPGDAGASPSAATPVAPAATTPPG